MRPLRPHLLFPALLALGSLWLGFALVGPWITAEATVVQGFNAPSRGLDRVERLRWVINQVNANVLWCLNNGAFGVASGLCPTDLDDEATGSDPVLVLQPIDRGGTLMQQGCAVYDITGVAIGEDIEIAVREYPPLAVGGFTLMSPRVRIDDTTVLGKVCASVAAPSTLADCASGIGIPFLTTTSSIGLSVEFDTADTNGQFVYNCWVDVAY
jgi:hypothetical protein